MKKNESNQPKQTLDNNSSKRIFTSGMFSANDGFIVQTMFIIFYFLERVSIFFGIRTLAAYADKKAGRIGDERSFFLKPIFPEIWAVGNALMALMWVYVLPLINCRWLNVVIGSYAMYRIFEMFVYQIIVLLFHRMASDFLVSVEATDKEDEKKSLIDQINYHIKSAPRTVILLLFNIFEYVAQFALVYAMLECLTKSSCIHVGMMDSFRLFMNASELEVASSGFLMRIAHAEIVIGIFVNIICLARFIGILPGMKELGYGNDKKE